MPGTCLTCRQHESQWISHPHRKKFCRLLRVHRRKLRVTPRLLPRTSQPKKARNTTTQHSPAPPTAPLPQPSSPGSPRLRDSARHPSHRPPPRTRSPSCAAALTIGDPPPMHPQHSTAQRPPPTPRSRASPAISNTSRSTCGGAFFRRLKELPDSSEKTRINSLTTARERKHPASPSAALNPHNAQPHPRPLPPGRGSSDSRRRTGALRADGGHPRSLIRSNPRPPPFGKRVARMRQKFGPDYS
mgnify:CR=1 FL=1